MRWTQVAYGLLVFLQAALLSCSSTKHHTTQSATQLKFKESYCAPTIAYEQSSDIWKETHPVTLESLSKHDQLLCKLLGISNDLRTLLHLKNDSTPASLLQKLSLKQTITSRIMLAQSQIQAVAAELDCEGERSDIAAKYVDGINRRRTTRLTIASVITGALTTVATAAISNNSAQVAAGVSGGLLSAGLGALTIKPKGKKMDYRHQRNVLQPIWANTADEAIYPGFVWQMLQEKQLSNSGDITLTESIKNRWMQFVLENKITNEKELLLFGNGGSYGCDDLEIRSAMLNQLQSTIRSFNQDLTSLIYYCTTL